ELPLKKYHTGEAKNEPEPGIEIFKIKLPGHLKAELNALAQQNKITPATLFYGAWALLLQQYAGSGDVVLGTAVSGRVEEIKGIEEIVGVFINTLPLRVTYTHGETVLRYLEKVNHTLRERKKFEETPLMKIIECSPVENKEALFDTIVIMENYPLDHTAVAELEKIDITSLYMYEQKTSYDLTAVIKAFRIKKEQGAQP
ncbi:MAG: hypothetical protein GY757_38275, partial [bacterium]|nr:hypothetical protein [bacterium]